MHQKQRDLQKRFTGFLNTPNFWNDSNIENLKQFELSNKVSKIDFEIDEKQRLGKYVEQFVFYQLKKSKAEILLENVQIQKEKRTLGELDCIINYQSRLIHLELVYKFYLYDASVGDSEIDHFIGPNRKDFLSEKLIKLKGKQLPLLYSAECKEKLNDYNIDVNAIEQQVCFKAQLYIPYKNSSIQLTKLNSECIVGFYIKQNELSDFQDCKFYVPIKKDWLIEPEVNVKWLSFSEFKQYDKKYYAEKYSPMLWLKHKNGELSKCFLVWW